MTSRFDFFTFLEKYSAHKYICGIYFFTKRKIILVRLNSYFNGERGSESFNLFVFFVESLSHNYTFIHPHSIYLVSVVSLLVVVSDEHVKQIWLDLPLKPLLELALQMS